jgi:hypothetical protein
MSRRPSLLLAALLIAGASPFSQANGDAGIDLYLADLDDLSALGRQGAFPNGINGCAMETTACNVGTKEINWQEVMDPDHPFIAFLIAREKSGRLEQISDRSYVKHGFFALSGSTCSPCSRVTDGSTLGIGCSDTYATQNNGDNFWLGPPDEINPWLGAWNPVCSHFDRGEPPVTPPADCNGARSLSNAQAQALGSVGHRVKLRDADLNVTGATFWFQGMYVIETETDAKREDNLASRKFTVSWTGSSWNLNETGALLHGTVLQRWNGASVSSVTNGNDDGRLYVAVKVTGPVDGFHHYEFAVHNRDNARGVSALRIPVCPEARVKNLGFSDIDQSSANNWMAARNGGEIAFSTATNPLKWNSIFNFWFDSDAAPASGTLNLDQAAAGPGLASVAITSTAPLGLYSVYLGPGCSRGTPPTLHPAGTPPQAALGNASFALRSTGNAPMEPHYLFFSRVAGTHSIGPCTSYLGAAPNDADFFDSVVADAGGVAVHAVPIPNKIVLEGMDVYFQAAGRRPASGRLLADYDLSDGLMVRIGSARAGCP